MTEYQTINKIISLIFKQLKVQKVMLFRETTRWLLSDLEGEIHVHLFDGLSKEGLISNLGKAMEELHPFGVIPLGIDTEGSLKLELKVCGMVITPYANSSAETYIFKAEPLNSWEQLNQLNTYFKDDQS